MSLSLDVAAVSRDVGLNMLAERLADLDDVGRFRLLPDLHDVHIERIHIGMGWSLDLFLQYAPYIVLIWIELGRLRRPRHLFTLEMSIFI